MTRDTKMRTNLITKPIAVFAATALTHGENSSDHSELEFEVTHAMLPCKIQASGLSSGEKLKVRARPFKEADFEDQYDDGSISQLEYQSQTSYLIECPGIFDLELDKTSGTNTAEIKIGLSY